MALGCSEYLGILEIDGIDEIVREIHANETCNCQVLSGFDIAGIETGGVRSITPSHKTPSEFSAGGRATREAIVGGVEVAGGENERPRLSWFVV